MTEGPKQPKPRTTRDPRETRLARALRENLRRRKANAGQSRPVKEIDDAER